MKEKTINQDVVNTNNPTETNEAETIATLKEEVARLTEENRSLAEKLQKTESDCEFYKKWWTNENDKCNAMVNVMKELIALAKLG